MDINTVLLGSKPLFAASHFRRATNHSHSVSLCSFWGSYVLQFGYFLIYSEIPAWKKLITQVLTTDECISRITAVFADSDQVKMVKNLTGDDVQSFIDKIDEVGSHVQKRGSFKPSHFID